MENNHGTERKNDRFRMRPWRISDQGRRDQPPEEKGI
jgi:hypothetical protein